MKKITLLFLVLFSALVLVACGSNADKDAVESAKNLLSVTDGGADGLIANFEVDGTIGDGVSVTWTSAKPAVLKVGAAANNKVTIEVIRPAVTETVVLTANLSKGDAKDSKTFPVKVQGLPADTVAPVIEGTRDFEFAEGATKPNWLTGVTATDNVDATVTVVVDDSKVNLNAVGSYDLVYSATDAAGNKAEVTVKVVVTERPTEDVDAPVISGTKNFTIIVGSEAPNWLEGVSASDTVDGAVTVTVDASDVNLDVIGVYDLVYSAVDAAGNDVQVTVKVHVEKAPDLLAPVISGVQNFTLQVGATAPEWLEGVTAEDDEDGDVEVTISRNTVKLDVAGTYTVTYRAVDAAGNVGTATSLVTVVASSTEVALGSVSIDGKTYANLELPTTVDGLAVTWVSSNPAAISNTGVVVRQSENVTVKLVATATAAEQQSIREYWVQVIGNNYNVNGTYKASYGEITTLNPLDAEGTSDSDVIDMITSTLYSGDYDWEKAIADGFASFPGDFSQIKSDRNPTGTVDMPSIAYKLTLNDAAAYPFAVNKNTDNSVVGSYGQVLDNAAAKATLDNEWIIKLRNDLVWADGTPINADTYEYSFKQYLNGDLANARANYLYTDNYVPLVNGKAYFDGLVEWSEVGYEKIDDLTFKLTLGKEVTQYSFIGSLSILKLVNPTSFAAGFDASGTSNNYGSTSNPLISYGAFTLANNYLTTNKFVFTRNENFHGAWDYNFKTIEGPIIKDQTQVINEFKLGNLDVAGVGGEFWNEFQNHQNLYISPSNSFYRIAISLDRNGDEEGVGNSAPILHYPEFRQALYLATDRNEFANTVQPPSQGKLGFLSNIHQVSEWASQAYASSDIFLQQLEALGLKPEEGGFDSVEAKRLFEVAYAQAVADGKYTQGQKVVVQYTYYDAGSNTRIANWVKAQYEEVFGENFEIDLNAVSSAELTQQRDAGNFDLVFTGMNGATFSATFGVGYIFSRSFSNFLAGRGHNTGELPVEADIIHLFDIVAAKDAYDEEAVIENEGELPEGMRSKSEQAFYEELEANDGTYIGTFDGLFLLYDSTSSLDVNYEGQEEDLTRITAALEGALLKQGIAVPLFSSTSAAVYSDKVFRAAHAYSLFMGWGGLSYTYIRA